MCNRVAASHFHPSGFCPLLYGMSQRSLHPYPCNNNCVMLHIKIQICLIYVLDCELCSSPTVCNLMKLLVSFPVLCTASHLTARKVKSKHINMTILLCSLQDTLSFMCREYTRVMKERARLWAPSVTILPHVPDGGVLVRHDAVDALLGPLAGSNKMTPQVQCLTRHHAEHLNASVNAAITSACIERSGCRKQGGYCLPTCGALHAAFQRHHLTV